MQQSWMFYYTLRTDMVIERDTEGEGDGVVWAEGEEVWLALGEVLGLRLRE